MLLIQWWLADMTHFLMFWLNRYHSLESWYFWIKRVGRGVGLVTSVFNIRLKKKCVNNTTGKIHPRTPGWKGDLKVQLGPKLAEGKVKDGNIKNISSGRANPVCVAAMRRWAQTPLSLFGWHLRASKHSPCPGTASPGLCPVGLARGAQVGPSLGGLPACPPCPAGAAGAEGAQPQAGFAPSPPQTSPGPGSHWHPSCISRPSQFSPHSIQDRELLFWVVKHEFGGGGFKSKP